MTLLLAVIGFGAPGVGLLVARWLTTDDPNRTVERHREALAMLGDLTARRTVADR